MPPQSKHKELLKLLYTDELTHIYNRRYLREQIPRYFKQADSKGLSLAFFMFDLDNFKGINDNYGHPVGDQALIHFSQIVVSTIKKRGIAIRYAGDEFVLIVPGVSKEKAAQVGSMIHQKMAQTPLKVGDKQIKLACSIGISLYPTDGKDWEELFEKADEALYTAKKQGKSKIVIFPDSGKLLTPEKLDSILTSPYIVGRDDVLHFIEKEFTKDGDPNTFAILLGSSGTGKTRLIEYADNIARKNLAFSLVAKGYSFWQTEMYGAVFAALGSLFEQRQDISDLIFKKLDNKYKFLLKPYLYPWDSKEVLKDEEVSTNDSIALFEALTQTFYILRELGDGAILLDDAEQIDPPSRQLFDSLFGDKEKGKLFFLASVNSTNLANGEENMLYFLSSMKEVSASATIKRFDLKPLRLEEMRQFVEKIFDGKKLPDAVEETLLKNSGGNPLFMVETISFLLQESKIETRGDSWDLSKVTIDDIPPRLDDLIKQRLMSMDEEAVNVLKLASVLGEKINPKQLAEMAGLNVHQILDILGNARRALLIEETPNPEEFIFAHRLDRSVFYSLMNDEERQDYHALAAEIEKKYGGGSLERVIGRLAYHYQNAGQLEDAAKMFSTLQKQMKAVLISEGTRKALQKRIITASMAKESPLEEEDLGKAVEVARAFKVATQNLRLYPKENENVKKSIERFLELLNLFLTEKTEALSISMTSETMLFNGQPPPPNKSDSRLTADLYSMLSSYGLQGVLFMRGIQPEEAVEFLEVLTLKQEDVAGQWDSIVEQKQFSHIFPDRKMFVAVGEHKIVLDEKELLARTAGKPSESTAPESGGGAISEQQIERIQKIAEDFSNDKKELIEALKSGAVGNQEIQRLIDLLEKSNLSDLANLKPSSVGVAPQEIAKAESGKDKYADTLPDIELVKQVESDISLAFEDLNSPDTNTRAKAAAWLMKQDPIKLSEATFNVICSEMPLKTRRLAAAIVEKTGQKAAEALLSKFKPSLPTKSLMKFLEVASIFAQEPQLISAIHQIILSGPQETLHSAFEILKLLPSKSVDGVLIDIFDRASERIKLNVLSLFAERGVVEALPTLFEYIEPKKMWEKDEQQALQAQICKTLGYLKSPDATSALISVALVPKPWTLLKAKPDTVRAAAAWALKQMPKSDEIEKIIEVLKKDRSALVRRAVS